MKKSKIFGNKSKFAIEIKQSEVDKTKYYLRFWFYDIIIGDFKQAGSVMFLIDDYYRLVKTSHLLYEPKFDNMTDFEIFSDISFYYERELSEEEEEECFEREGRYVFAVADNQFNDYSMVVFYNQILKNVKVLVYKMADPTHVFDSFVIEIDYFFEVYKEVVEHLERD